MWLEPLSQCLVAVAFLGQTAATAPPTMPELLTTRQPVFPLQFSVDQTIDAARQPIEVQLHVSNDRGAHWQLYAKAPPTQKHFMFRAGEDREYWFAIRTIDRSGQVRPETITGPGMRVRVDTQPPVIKLTAQPGQPGQVVVRWEINESSIKPDSLRIQYRASFSDPWQPVAIDTGTSSPQQGEATFWPKQGVKELQIRAEVSDAAGNPAVAHAQVQLDQDVGMRTAAAAVKPETPKTQSTEKPVADAEPKGSVAIAINPAVGKRYVASDKRSGSAETVPGLPPGERPRMVNSRLFELEYDVDSVGPSGIGRVELWGTRDAGKTWRSFTLDNDNRSPLLVNVEEEGVYGFCVVVTNGLGLGGQQPKSGDLPDLWVGIDLTKPTARIVSAQQGVDAEAGQLIISWQADDRTLAARPVSLSFSQARTGPWLPIASGLENTGRYAWTIDSRTPAQFYLRLEVRDEAGNVGTHETTEPLAIDQSRPTIRVRDIRPVNQANARPTQPR